jgi:hypothetical protein
LLLRVPTALWSAIERCLGLLVVATLLVAVTSSAFAAGGTVVTIQGRVRVLAPAPSVSSSGALLFAGSSWGLPGPAGDAAAHAYPSRQPRTGSTAFVVGPRAIEPVTSVTFAARSVWGSACSCLRWLQQRLDLAVPTPKP